MKQDLIGGLFSIGQLITMRQILDPVQNHNAFIFPDYPQIFQARHLHYTEHQALNIYRYDDIR